MHLAIKVCAMVLATLIAVAGFAALAYDIVAFRPHIPAIRAVLDAASAECRSPTDSVARLVRASHRGRLGLAGGVSRDLRFKLDPERPGGVIGWHARSAAWTLLIRLHLGDEAVLGLHCTLAYNGQDHGLDRLSLRLFDKPLDRLTDAEAATVVAMAWSPALYAMNPDRLARRRDILLSRMGEFP